MPLSGAIDLDRVLITGGDGMLGRAVLWGIKTDRSTLDVTDSEAVFTTVRQLQPSAILHLAALDIWRCEEDHLQAYRTNVLGTYHLANVAREIRAPLIFLSSGAVFNGAFGVIHDETAKPDPVNVYGQTKFLAELFILATVPDVLVVRTGWVFGGHQAHHRKFFDIAVEKALGNQTIDAVVDRWGSPTYLDDLLSALERLIVSRARGIVHVANRGAATGEDIARKIVSTLGSGSSIKQVKVAQLAACGKQPLRAVSEVLASTTMSLRPWDAALHDYLRNRVR